jgi:phospholipid/cholesterol/gamma-HCH transport system permease protein
MKAITSLGSTIMLRLRDLQYLLSVLVAIAMLAVQPRYWSRTVRNVLARQILFTGVESLGLIVAVASVVGISVVLQAQVWLGKVGRRDLLGPLVVVVVVREFAPVLASLVVIIRSASAVAAEMANMQLAGEVRLLDAQGLDPLVYLVMPRVVGVSVCAFGLSILFVVVSLVSGYLFVTLLGHAIRPRDFADSVFGALGPVDMLNLLGKSVVPAALTAVICCTEGLSVGAGGTEIPRATSRGLARSVIAMFVVAGAISVVTYL